MEAVFLAVEKELIPGKIPDLAGKIALEVAPRLKPLGHLLREKKAKWVGGVGLSEGYTLKCHWEALPLVDQSCDFLFYRLFYVHKDLEKILREASRVLKPGGSLLMMDFHPFSLPIQEEYRRSPVTEDGFPPGFERYFRFFQTGGLRLGEVKEIFFDVSCKKHFEKKETFEDFRKTPFLVMMILGKEAP